MEIEACLSIVLSLASLEAQMLGCPEVEPVHMLCALLKFAELDSVELETFTDSTNAVEQIRLQHQHLRFQLSDSWGISVPVVSTSIRRSLRRRCEGRVTQNPGGLLHRSVAAREACESARAFARRDGRDNLDLVDLATVIMHHADAWTSRILTQHKIATGQQLLDRQRSFEQWRDLFVPIHANHSETSPQCLGKHLDPKADATVRVLFERLNGSSPRPCLLVYGPDRSALEVITDLKTIQNAELLPKFLGIDSRALLQRFATESILSLSSFFDFLVSENNPRTIWFFDSLHRYLGDDIALRGLQAFFRPWLKLTDNRFLFAITESHYGKLVEQQAELKNIFHTIWIHANATESIDEL